MTSPNKAIDLIRSTLMVAEGLIKFRIILTIILSFNIIKHMNDYSYVCGERVIKMKYDVYAKAIWFIFSKDCFNGLAEKNILINRQFKHSCKNEYKNMIENTPSIGRMKENTMSLILLFACMIFSIYKTCDNDLTSNDVRNMFQKIEQNPIMIKFSKKSVFTEKWQSRRQAMAKRSLKNKFEYDWQSELIQGTSINEFELRFFTCGICKLAKRENANDIVKELCRFDYWMAEKMGATLVRNQTIADGSPTCEFNYHKTEI